MNLAHDFLRCAYGILPARELTQWSLWRGLGSAEKAKIHAALSKLAEWRLCEFQDRKTAEIMTEHAFIGIYFSDLVIVSLYKFAPDFFEPSLAFLRRL